MLVLEELGHALDRGAPIYAELVGYALSNDAHHITSPPADGHGAARCMAAALRSAGIEPSLVGYVNAHGTSTEANDSAETAALHTVFGDHAKGLAADIGFELKDMKTGGCSDGNFTGAMDIPTLDGLGADGQGAHTLDEFIYYSSLVERCRLMIRLFETLK